MTMSERKTIIKVALQDYRYAKQSGNKKKIAIALNGMENAYIAVSLWGVPGAEELRQTIRSAYGLATS